MPRRLVHPRTGDLVTLRPSGGQLLVTSEDARVSAAERTDETLLAGAKRVRTPPGSSLAAAAAVEGDRYADLGYVLLTKSQPLASVLSGMEPFRSWHAVAADIRHLAVWWAQWGAPTARVKLLVELCVSVTVRDDALVIDLGRQEVWVTRPAAAEQLPSNPFLSGFGAVHQRIHANEFEAGEGLGGDVEFLRTELPGAKALVPFLNVDDAYWWLADIDGASRVYRQDAGLELVDATPAAVIVDELIRRVSEYL